MKALDLRFREPGCTGHPVLRLNNKLRDVSEPEVIVRFSAEDIPLKAFELLVGKYGYRVCEIKDFGAYVEVRIARGA